MRPRDPHGRGRVDPAGPWRALRVVGDTIGGIGALVCLWPRSRCRELRWPIVPSHLSREENR
jgi:hypothetical protein